LPGLSRSFKLTGTAAGGYSSLFLLLPLEPVSEHVAGRISDVDLIPGAASHLYGPPSLLPLDFWDWGFGQGNHRIIGWKRPLRPSSPTIHPTPPCLLNHIPQCHIYTVFEPLQGWGLHHRPGQPGPMKGRTWVSGLLCTLMLCLLTVCPPKHEASKATTEDEPPSMEGPVCASDMGPS